MTLIELLEWYQPMIKKDYRRAWLRAHLLKSMGVNAVLVDALELSVKDSGEWERMADRR